MSSISEPPPGWLAFVLLLARLPCADAQAETVLGCNARASLWDNQAMYHLLLIEDDRPLREELAELLRNNGYAVTAPADFAAITQQALDTQADLALVDLTLPGVDGLYLCRELRAHSPIPLIVVTSRSDEMDELLAMNAGADDFITKPYRPQILLARIASVLNRTYGQRDEARLLSCGNVTLDLARCTVSVDGREQDLTKNELRLLQLLMARPGEVVTRAAMQDYLWSSNEFIDDNTLTVNISHLRSKLKAVGAQDAIETRRGIGYIFKTAQSDTQ